MCTMLRPRGESFELTGDAIVETDAKGEEEIRGVHGVVGVDGAVHAEHVEAELIGRGVAPEAHEGVGDGIPVDSINSFSSGAASRHPPPAYTTGRLDP